MPDGVHSERGESLVELLVAISIIGIGIITLVGGLTVAIMSSGAHRQQADAGAVARNVAEEIKDTTEPFVNSGGDYSSAWSDVSAAGTSISVSTECWNGSTPATPDTFGDCPTESGLQKITVTVSTGKANEKVTILKRRIS